MDIVLTRALRSSELAARLEAIAQTYNTKIEDAVRVVWE